MKESINYKAPVCPVCLQSTEYLIPLDSGSVDIVRAIAVRIRRKGINVVHLTREMEVPGDMWSSARALQEGVLTSIQIGNISKPRAHGLVARVKGMAGNWCLTDKGFKFLRGEPVPRYAIISKVRGCQIGYFEPERWTCTAESLRGEDPYWEGVGFTIEQGHVVISDQPKLIG